MTEHNLQALDMRHTLPNLKNLLLTLTTEATEDDPALPTMYVLRLLSEYIDRSVIPSIRRKPLRPQDTPVPPTTIGPVTLASMSSAPYEMGSTSSQIACPSPRRSGLFSPIALTGLWQSRNTRLSPALIKSSLPVTLEDPDISAEVGSDSATVRSLHLQKAPIDD